MSQQQFNPYFLKEPSRKFQKLDILETRFQTIVSKILQN